MKNQRIKLVKAYQSVKFEGAENSYFTATDFKSTFRSSAPLVEISRTELGSIIVKSPKCMIEIGLANIAYIEYVLEADEDAEIVAELKSKKAK